MESISKEMRDLEYLEKHGKFEMDAMPFWLVSIYGEVMGRRDDISKPDLTLLFARLFAVGKELDECRKVLDVPDCYMGGAEAVIKYVDMHCGKEQRSGNKIKRMLYSLAEAYRTACEQNVKLRAKLASASSELAHTQDDVL